MPAFSVTALELVNRVNRRRRMPDVTSITAVEDLATLNAINSSIEEVMESENWEFNHRNDGQLPMVEYSTDVNATVTLPFPGGSATAIVLTDTSNSTFFAKFLGSAVARVLFNGDGQYANTAFRIEKHTVQIVTSVTGFTTTPFYENVSALNATVYWSEYILPDTVASVTRVRFQEDDLLLEQVEPTVEYDELFPRPSIQFGPPEIVAVGGFDRASYVTTSPTPSPGLRLAVWPVPDEHFILQYSYQYRHPELTDETSELVGVPPNVVSRIVDLAATDMKIYYDDDKEALLLREENFKDIGRAHSRHGGSRAGRKPIGNWDGSASRSVRYRDGFSGKLIG